MNFFFHSKSNLLKREHAGRGSEFKLQLDANAARKGPEDTLKRELQTGQNRFSWALRKLSPLAFLAFACAAVAQDNITWRLLPDAKVDSSGIFLSQLVVPSSSSTVDPTSVVVLPHIRLAPAPILGQTASLSRVQIIELAQKYYPELVISNWSGAMQIRVSRRTRQFTDSQMTELLAATLQRDYVKDRGELELNFTRPFAPALVPDEPLTIKIVEMPAVGISPNFVVRCELWNGKERVSDWQLAAQARVWREIPVARSRITRGQLVKDADITLERRDVLVQRDALTPYPAEDAALEFAETVAPGMPVLNRAVRIRPIIQRGRVVEGVYQDGSLSISLKVEALEDGLLGQTVRVRNPKTKREIYGKVQNEQTVLISL